MRFVRTLIFLALCAAGAGADTLMLKDGRLVERPEITDSGDGYVVKFEHGEVTVPGALVLHYFKENAAGEYEPVTEEQKRKFEKGYAPWKGRWVRLSKRERLRKEAEEARREHVKQMKERRLWRNRRTVETRRFKFVHTLPDEVFAEFQDLFETYYDYFTKYWRFRPASDFGKVTINIYNNRGDFEQISGAPSGVVGWYMPHKRDLNFYYDRENHRYTVDVMFHEGNHMLTHMIDADMWYPWWIGEGMAEYFGASEWDPEKKEMKIGLLQGGRLAVLKEQFEKQKLELKTLLETDGMGAVGYAWAWSFCHFLLHTEAYEKRFRKYFLAVARDRSIKRVPRMMQFKMLPAEERSASLLRYLKVRDIEELQKEWYEYIETQLALQRKRDDVNWGQAGYVMKMYGEQPKARLFFKRAIEQGSKEAYVHFGYAELKWRQNMSGIATKYAHKALEIDPLHAGAIALLGDIKRAAGEAEEGLRLLELAHEIAPEDSGIWLRVELARQDEQKK